MGFAPGHTRAGHDLSPPLGDRSSPSPPFFSRAFRPPQRSGIFVPPVVPYLSLALLPYQVRLEVRRVRIQEVVATAPHQQARPSRPVPRPATGVFDHIEASADVEERLERRRRGGAASSILNSR